jgi:hypothetical protein
MLKTMTLALAIASGFGLAAPASAALVSTGIALPALAVPPSYVEPAAWRRYPWSPGQPAARHRYGPYVHYHDGWWYPQPWVYTPRIGLGVVTGNDSYDNYYQDYDYVDTGYGDPHIEWCFDHYRSYDPQSDSFIGHDGDRHACLTPFD